MIRVLRETTPTAKRNYICGACEFQIHKGAIYYYQAQRDDEGFSYYRAHIACERYYNDYWKWVGYEPDEYDTPEPEQFRQFVLEKMAKDLGVSVELLR